MLMPSQARIPFSIGCVVKALVGVENVMCVRKIASAVAVARMARSLRPRMLVCACHSWLCAGRARSA